MERTKMITCDICGFAARKHGFYKGKQRYYCPICNKIINPGGSCKKYNCSKNGRSLHEWSDENIKEIYEKFDKNNCNLSSTAKEIGKSRYIVSKAVEKATGKKMSVFHADRIRKLFNESNK